MFLKDKTVIVTGGTRGIGRAIVKSCVAEGANVVFSGRDEAAAETLLRELGEPGGAGVSQSGAGVSQSDAGVSQSDAGVSLGGAGVSGIYGKARFIRTDLTDADACYALVDAAAGWFGRLDGLVNNAGIFPPGTVLDTSAETFDNVLSVNVRAPFLLCQRAISYMLKSGGSIVNIGSTHAETGSPNIAAYAVSKGALRTLTRHIALNYAAAGIRANWITVGWVLTEGDYAAQRGRGLDDAQIRANAAGRIPSGRYQEGSEIADAAIFLLSDRASSHTDTDMRVTGGFTPGFGLPAGINVPEKNLNF